MFKSTEVYKNLVLYSLEKDIIICMVPYTDIHIEHQMYVYSLSGIEWVGGIDVGWISKKRLY